MFRIAVASVRERAARANRHAPPRFRPCSFSRDAGGFTRAESRVVRRLARGLAPAEVAEELGRASAVRHRGGGSGSPRPRGPTSARHAPPRAPRSRPRGSSRTSERGSKAGGAWGERASRLPSVRRSCPAHLPTKSGGGVRRSRRSRDCSPEPRGPRPRGAWAPPETRPGPHRRERSPARRRSLCRARRGADPQFCRAFALSTSGVRPRR